MPNAVGFVDDTTQYANREMLETIRDFVDLNGWTILEEDDTSDTRYWIASTEGYTGPDGQIVGYVGMRSYQSVGADYYNLSVAAFTGYVSGNSFTTQPGYTECGIPAHNQRIDYWMTMNERRLALGMKVGTPVYELAYLGFALPYATPRQWPYPMVCSGPLSGLAATRFSDTAHFMGYRGGGNNRLRFVDGTYKNPTCYPWGNGFIGGDPAAPRPTDAAGTYYPLQRIVMYGASDLWGEFDGVYKITGFDNAVENTLSIGGETYVVLQDVWRTGFDDYIALRLET